MVSEMAEQRDSGMAVISLTSSKGGVGKTTTSLVIASVLAEAGHSVTVIDACQNKPMEAWLETNDVGARFNVVVMDTDDDKIAKPIKEARANSDFVIVDLKGSMNTRMALAIAHSDLVLIPTSASALDFSEAMKCIDLVNELIETLQRPIPWAIVQSMAEPAIRTRTSRLLAETVQENKFPIIPVPIVRRDAFRSIFSFGKDLYQLTDEEVGGLPRAKENAEAFVRALTEYLPALAAEKAEGKE